MYLTASLLADRSCRGAGVAPLCSGASIVRHARAEIVCESIICIYSIYLMLTPLCYVYTASLCLRCSIHQNIENNTQKIVKLTLNSARSASDWLWNRSISENMTSMPATATKLGTFR